ncbi:hypothetical protein BASA50_006467 [Batrachochytrium salamandrivorans]|uniref:HhH-GPD domain-containing protein n=1 Tax=Batrachochytrium salamandrivorans TaxID=1357716 RepID=A0ABQ8F9Y4_9FUNG|nr:hypothetical protein BASA50_006467 [Batrachochytrium salamandrivorans]
MDSSHSDYYRQTSSYHSNLDVLAASAISDAVDCLKCSTALLQLCDIALDDGPLRPAWPLKGADIEHFPTPVRLISNIPAAPSTDTTDMAISAPAATAKRGCTAARSKKAASIKRGGLSTAPISNSIIDSEKEDAMLLKRKRARKDGRVPTQRKKTCKVAVQPVVEKSTVLKKRLEPANPLATAGDTMPTEDELKTMAYITSSLQIVPYSSELFKIYSTSLACLPDSSNSSSTMECTDETKDETVDLLLTLNGVGARVLKRLLMQMGEADDHLRRTLKKLFKLFGSLWEFYFPLVMDISQRNSGRRRCNARSDLGLALVAAAPPSLSSLPARLKNKRAATEFTDSDKTAPKRLCKL